MAIISVVSDEKEINKRWERYKVLSSVQTVQTRSDEVWARHARSIALWGIALQSSVNGGVIVLEGAPYAGYTGTWATLTNITLSSGNQAFVACVDEGDAGFLCEVVRARITTAISNGFADVYIITQG